MLTAYRLHNTSKKTDRHATRTVSRIVHPESRVCADQDQIAASGHTEEQAQLRLLIPQLRFETKNPAIGVDLKFYLLLR